MFEHKELKDENEIIEAKALPTTKKKKKANLPNEFVTNDDFCPGCGLELKALPVEKVNLWTDVFDHDLQEGFDAAQVFEHIKPGLLTFEGWGLERQLSAERRVYIDALRADIEARKKAMPPHYPYVHGVQDAEKAVNQNEARGNPFNLGEEVPRGFLSVLSPDAPRRLQTEAAGASWRMPSSSSRSRRVSSSTASGRATSGPVWSIRPAISE